METFFILRVGYIHNPWRTHMLSTNCWKYMSSPPFELYLLFLCLHSSLKRGQQCGRFSNWVITSHQQIVQLWWSLSDPPNIQHTHPSVHPLHLARTCYPFCPNNLYNVGWDQSWTVITVRLHFLNWDNKKSYKNRDCHTVCLFQRIRIMTSPSAPAASQSIPPLSSPIICTMSDGTNPDWTLPPTTLPEQRFL